jgi:hypothetical protein
MNMFRLATIAFAAAVVASVIFNWADIKRYVKIEQM